MKQLCSLYVVVISISVFRGPILIHLPKSKSDSWLRYTYSYSNQFLWYWLCLKFYTTLFGEMHIGFCSLLLPISLWFAFARFYRRKIGIIKRGPFSFLWSLSPWPWVFSFGLNRPTDPIKCNGGGTVPNHNFLFLSPTGWDQWLGYCERYMG